MFSFKSFADYADIKPIEAKTDTAPTQFVAREKSKTCNDDPIYTDRWFILRRKGLFGAQVEKAMAETDQYFLGYSTSVEIIKEGDDYYVASREISNFKTWAECRVNVKMLEDGTLVLLGKTKNKIIKGLGTVCTYADFFGGRDPHSRNFGIQEREDDCIVFLIDRESSLDFDDEDSNNFENEFASGMLTDYRKAAWFQQERRDILKKIADADLSVVEAILKKHITSNKLEDSKRAMEAALKTAQDTDKQQFIEALENIAKEDPNKHGIESIINALRTQHKTLREEPSTSNQPIYSAFFQPAFIKENNASEKHHKCRYPVPN